MLTSLALAVALGPAHAALPPDALALFAKKCASCHGQDGRGNVKMEMGLKLAPGTLDMGREASRNLNTEELETIVRKGKGKMPSFEKKLTADEISDALKFVVQVREKTKPAAK